MRSKKKTKKCSYKKKDLKTYSQIQIMKMKCKCKVKKMEKFYKMDNSFINQ